MSQIKGMGTENGSQGGALITACTVQVMWREPRRKVLKATRLRPAAVPVSTASTSSRQTHAFHFPPFFPSFFSAPHMPDRTPRLPQCSPSTSREGSKGLFRDPEEWTWPPLEGLKPGRPPPTSSHRASRKDPGTHLGRDAMEHGKFFFC